jgi:opacity protein-like surface antigen
MKRLVVTAALFLACLAPIFAVDVPDEDEIKSISDKMLLDWNKAMQKDDFTAFYKKDCAKVWQEDTTAEKLDDLLGTKQFGGQKIDFSGAIKEMEPNFEPEPAIAKVGDFDVLTVQGYYDTKPNRFSFRLKLVQEDEAWKLVGLNIKLDKPTDE